MNEDNVIVILQEAVRSAILEAATTEMNKHKAQFEFEMQKVKRQGAQSNVPCQLRAMGWSETEGSSRGRGRMCTCDRFMLMYGRNQHNIVKQLSSNKKKFF